MRRYLSRSSAAALSGSAKRSKRAKSSRVKGFVVARPSVETTRGGGGRRETGGAEKKTSISVRALLAKMQTLSLLRPRERLMHSDTQLADALKVPMRAPLTPFCRNIMANQRCCCCPTRKMTDTNTKPNTKPSPSQLEERLHGHAGPTGRRGTPGAGEEAQPDGRGGVEAALEERRFGKLRRRRRRMLCGCRGRLELSSCRRCRWQRRRRRRRARGRRRRRHKKREREGGAGEERVRSEEREEASSLCSRSLGCFSTFSDFSSSG